jgi:hypothetical protein
MVGGAAKAPAAPSFTGEHLESLKSGAAAHSRHYQATKIAPRSDSLSSRAGGELFRASPLPSKRKGRHPWRSRARPRRASRFPFFFPPSLSPYPTPPPRPATVTVLRPPLSFATRENSVFSRLTDRRSSGMPANDTVKSSPPPRDSITRIKRTSVHAKSTCCLLIGIITHAKHEISITSDAGSAAHANDDKRLIFSMRKVARGLSAVSREF